MASSVLAETLENFQHSTPLIPENCYRTLNSSPENPRIEIRNACRINSHSERTRGPGTRMMGRIWRRKTWRRRDKLAHVVMLLTFTPEVPGSNRDQDTGFPALVFSWSSTFSPVLRSGHGGFLPSPFQYINHSAIRYYEVESVNWSQMDRNE
jgi:hypothetical protein